MLNTMFICIMDYITEEKGGSQFSRVHLPFSVVRVFSVNWFFNALPKLVVFNECAFYHEDTQVHILPPNECLLPLLVLWLSFCSLILALRNVVRLLIKVQNSPFFQTLHCVFWGSFWILWNLSLKFILLSGSEVT